jgi:aldose 1-epimerase
MQFGKAPEGEPVELFTLTSGKGMEARIMTWGAAVVSLRVPDADGRCDDVALGYDTLEGYLRHGAYFGATVGRYANRIGNARFRLNGREHELSANNGANSLHGGQRGFDKRVWTAVHADARSLELQYRSEDGEEGYPGNLTVTVRYTVSPGNELRIEYTASTDKETVLNLTNHSYFNLAGAGNGTVLDEEIEIRASRFTPVDAGSIPTGELRSVEGTPLDFRKPVRIGARIHSSDEQLQIGNGYDHNWVLDKPGGALALAARVYDPLTGRIMEVLTTEPGLQFYTGNFLDPAAKGRGGTTYPRRGALCLETQHFPDSPNRSEFPSTTLQPGAIFRSMTIYRFSVREK